MVPKLFIVMVFATGTLALLENVVPTDKIQMTSSVENIVDPNVPLKLECLFSPSQHPSVARLVSLKLFKKPFEGADYSHLVSVTARGIQDEDAFNGVATGAVHNGGGSDSVLKVEYPRTNGALRGVYKCQAVGLDEAGIVVASERTLTIGPMNSTEIHKCMENQPTDSLTITKESLLRCGAFEDDWFEVLRDVTAHTYNAHPDDVTDIFNSSSFYIIITFVNSFKEAVARCRQHNGYLAEINSQEELNFLYKPLSDFQEFHSHSGSMYKRYLLGVFFNNRDGKFEFYTHKDALMYLGNWATGQPSVSFPELIWVTLFSYGYRDLEMLITDKERNHYKDDFLCEVSKDIP